jgi:hypothetical protein
MSLNDLLVLAERSFAFLLDRGFDLRSRSPATTESFRDGWSLDYHSSSVKVRVEYLEMQLNVLFTHNSTTVSYLMIDRELHEQRSGFYGDMFPAEGLPVALNQIATDIAHHYSAVLAGDASLWERLKRLSNAPVTKKRLP